MKKIKMIFCSIFMLFAMFSIQAQTVVVTNSWTAAFAELAGAKNIVQLAPSEMKHPPEYEISLKEMQMVASADILIFAGYEGMMSRIKESLGQNSQVQMIQIKTINNQMVIRESVLKIAEALNTQDKAEENLRAIDSFFELWRNDLSWHKALLSNSIVHFHQQGLASSLGFDTKDIIGPAPPSLGEIANILDLKPALIIDNYHNPISAPFLEMEDPADAILWINFPGSEGTRSLLDVLEYNRNQLLGILD